MAGPGSPLADFAPGFCTMSDPNSARWRLRERCDHAAKLAEDERQKSMNQMSAKFCVLGGAKVYVKED